MTQLPGIKIDDSPLEPVWRGVKVEMSSGRRLWRMHIRIRRFEATLVFWKWRP